MLLTTLPSTLFNNYSPNVLTWSCSDTSAHGVIQFDGGERGMSIINYYWSCEQLQFGDHVEFRIATRSFDKLQYADELKVQQRAKDIRFKVRDGRGGEEEEKSAWCCQPCRAMCPC